MLLVAARQISGTTADNYDIISNNSPLTNHTIKTKMFHAVSKDYILLIDVQCC